MNEKEKSCKSFVSVVEIKNTLESLRPSEAYDADACSRQASIAIVSILLAMSLCIDKTRTNGK